MDQTLKNLPIGIQDFESLINDGYLYVANKETDTPFFVQGIGNLLRE